MQRKTYYRNNRPDENDLSPRAYKLLSDMYTMIVGSGLKLKEIRLVCRLLRGKVEHEVEECAVGGREG